MGKQIINRFKYFVLALAMCLGMNSCLEKEPADFIRTEEAMTSYSEAEQLLVGIYADWKSSALYSGLLTLLPDIQTDLVYAINGNTNTYVDIWQWDILPTNRYVESVYAALYGVIGDCNFFLDKLPSLRESISDDTQLAILVDFEGEVRVSRALAYSELIKLFCKAYDPATAANELGVVLVSHYDGSEPAVRASLKDSYEFVLSDLEQAEILLLEEDDLGYNSVYFTLSVAQSLHARVALYMQDWDDAIRYSTLVLNKKEKFELSNARTVYDAAGVSYFDYLWQYDSGFEVIWKVGFTATSFGGMLGSPFLHLTTDYAHYYPDFVPSTYALSLYDPSDLRYDSYFLDVTTGHSHGLTWPVLVKYFGNRNFINSANLFELQMPKPFRLAEQFLIRAEAYCRKGEYSKGAADLGTLRKARFAVGGTISMNADNWLNTISEERARELYMEGFRLNDLKRWGMGFERKPQSESLSEGSSLKISAGDPLFVWPIPKHELESPGSQIQPNESNK
ncbi:MAG: RagB/SusD family nutrient uptake outer membrane protein [Bacteroidales bacterium]|nr:RagB/SusD family nutrient uptake outer membrane protein [Bacteroidales bacterium]